MKKTLLILLITTLIGCASSGDRAVASNYPKLGSTNSLKGVDDNTNGIRDDIDAFIESQKLPERERRAVQFQSRTIQDAIVYGESDIKSLSKVIHDYKKAMSCMMGLNSDEKSALYRNYVTSSIEKLSINTTSRYKSYMKFIKNFNGDTFSSSEYKNACSK